MVGDISRAELNSSRNA